MKRNDPSSTGSRSAALLVATAALVALQACTLPGVLPTAASVAESTIPSLESLRPATPEPSEDPALHSLVTASAAVDGDPQTVWNAGAHAPQWIEIDLGAAFDLDRVILTVAEDPRGGTVHQISARGETGDYRLLYKFHEDTGDGLELEVSPVAGWAAVRYLKIETTESLSWVAWREIAVFGRPSFQPLAQVRTSRAWPTSIAPQL